MAWKKYEIDEARESLINDLNPKTKFYLILRSTSNSGMSRVISVYILHDGEMWDISRRVAKACDMSYDKNKEGVRIGGCGMDMGFALIHDLVYTLFPGAGQVQLNYQWL